MYVAIASQIRSSMISSGRGSKLAAGVFALGSYANICENCIGYVFINLSVSLKSSSVSVGYHIMIIGHNTTSATC